MRWAILLLTLSGTVVAAEERPRVSSGFGVRSDPIHGRRAVHRGIDMPGREGTRIVAAAGGVVRVAGRRGGYGLMVEIAHSNGTATRYAHLSRILVRPSEAVRQGQAIAEMGSTGRSTGSHLHFEYRVGGVAIDPRPYLGPRTYPAASTPDRVGARHCSVQTTAIPHRSRFARMRDARAAQP